MDIVNIGVWILKIGKDIYTSKNIMDMLTNIVLKDKFEMMDVEMMEFICTISK